MRLPISNFRFSLVARRLLEALAAKLDVKMIKVLELAIRLLAKQKKVK